MSDTDSVALPQHELPCGCKGIRTCAMCDGGSGKQNADRDENDAAAKVTTLFWCHECGGLRKSENAGTGADCGNPCTTIPRATRGEEEHNETSDVDDAISRLQSAFTGVHVLHEFITSEEEVKAIQVMDAWEWKSSQSGRLKQDFGPKVNFKRQKVKQGNFSGLPRFSKHFVERMHADVDALEDFYPVEQCHLDYRSERGAAIDPHFDDEWVWGERLVTINFIGKTYLTFTKEDAFPGIEVLVPMPPRSLVVVAGNARFTFQHSIQRHHVPHRRIAATFRELGEDFVKGGPLERVGDDLLSIASSYSGCPI